MSYLVLSELYCTHVQYCMYVGIRMYVVLPVLCCQFQLVWVGVCTTSVIPKISLSWCVCIECEAVFKGQNWNASGSVHNNTCAGNEANINCGKCGWQNRLEQAQAKAEGEGTLGIIDPTSPPVHTLHVGIASSLDQQQFAYIINISSQSNVVTHYYHAQGHSTLCNHDVFIRSYIDLCFHWIMSSCSPLISCKCKSSFTLYTHECEVEVQPTICNTFCFLLVSLTLHLASGFVFCMCLYAYA